MTVYVDNARVRAGRRAYPMSHMAADSLEELHAFVAALGLRAHFHAHPEHPHYDVNDWQRNDAIKAGAQEVRPRELLAIAVCAKLNAS
jgi:signal recognition particle subunit SEC65